MDEDKAESAQNNHEDTKKNRIGDVISTIKLATYIENLFGIFRFSLLDGELRLPNKKEKFFSTVISFTIVAIYVFITQQRELEDASITYYLDIIPSILIVVHYTVSAIITTFLFSRTNSIIFNNFANLDKMLAVQTTEEFYNTGRYRTKKLLTLLILYHIISAILDFITDGEPATEKLIIELLYFLENIEIFIMCILLGMLKRRLEIINRYLTIFIDGKQEGLASKSLSIFVRTKVAPVDNYNWIGRASVDNTKIRDLATIYDMVGTICSLINEISNLKIFLNLLSTFFYIVISIWSIIYFFRAPEYTFQWLITIIIWCSTSLLTVAVICFVCERLLSERNRTKVLVNQIIMDYDLPKTMRVQAKAFMELIEAWPLRIFIYDMLSVDITLMLKFISVATTYLIVIVQISHFV